jgi:hypothetical protein
MKPLVFVAMPFGEKPDPTRQFTVNFDDIYERAIKPAVARFEVDCIRADEERSGGVIHLPMYERLLLAEIAIVDVTFSNPNVFYELGIRHAAKPRSTIILSANEGSLPFDIAMIRAVPYKLTEGKLEDAAAKELQDALAQRLGDTLHNIDGASDSPLFEMIPNLKEPSLPHEVTDAFRDRARAFDGIRQRIDAARRLPNESASTQLGAIACELGELTRNNAELFLEIFLAYRDIEDFDAAIAFADDAPVWLKESVQMLAEQQAFALNRRYEKQKNPADRVRAEQILNALLEQKGASPETSSLLGRIYKSQYKDALAAGERIRAAGFLNQAIDQYRAGFMADPRDYYPGVNLVTLLATKGTPDALEEYRRTVPAVAFALSRLGALKSKDYWQLATVFEIAISGNDADTATRALEIMETLDAPRWCFETTLGNLQLLRSVPDNVVDKQLLDEMSAELQRKLDSMKNEAS